MFNEKNFPCTNCQFGPGTNCDKPIRDCAEWRKWFGESWRMLQKKQWGGSEDASDTVSA